MIKVVEHIAHAMGDKSTEGTACQEVMEHVTHAVGDKRRDRYGKRPGTT